jgi:zinc protease
MKRRIVVLIVALCTAVTARAQMVADSMTTSFTVDGVHVILRRNAANDVVAANIYLLGGARQLTPGTAGIEALMLAASEGGTRDLPRQQLQAITARLGATIVIDPGPDWTVFGVRALRAAFDSSWMVLTDRLMAPRLDSADVERARQQKLTSAAQRDVEPDDRVARMAGQMLYAGTPYELDPEGDTTSLRQVTQAEVRRYHDAQVVASRLLVVVVGNITRGELEQAVRRTLGHLPAGSYHWQLPAALTPSPDRVLLEDRALATNYILGYYAGPVATSADYAALRVATAVLSGRLFAEVRSRRNLAYAVEAPFLERPLAVGGLYVTTTDPDAALRVMHDEVQELQTALVDPDGLHMLVGQFITDYFLKNETNADQATFLARAQIYQGDYRAANRFVEDLRRVRPEDVRRVARQYMHDFRFVYLGRSGALSRALIDQF